MYNLISTETPPLDKTGGNFFMWLLKTQGRSEVIKMPLIHYE